MEDCQTIRMIRHSDHKIFPERTIYGYNTWKPVTPFVGRDVLTRGRSLYELMTGT